MAHSIRKTAVSLTGNGISGLIRKTAAICLLWLCCTAGLVMAEETFTARNDWTYQDSYIAFTVTDSPYYIVQQMPSESGPYYTAGSIGISGGLPRPEAAALYTVTDPQLLSEVAAYGMQAANYRDLFSQYGEIESVETLRSDTVYEFGVSYYIGNLLVKDYIKYMNLNPTTGEVFRVACYSMQDAESGWDYYRYYQAFYDSFTPMLKDIRGYSRAERVPAAKTLCANLSLDTSLKEIISSSVSAAQAYADGRVSSQSAANHIQALKNSVYAGNADQDAQKLIDDQLASLILYIQDEMMDQVQIGIHNLTVYGNLKKEDLSGGSARGDGQSGSASSGQTFTPPVSASYWMDDMRYQYAPGYWYSSWHGISCYLPMGWKQTPLTQKALDEGIEVQYYNGNGVSISIYAGKQDYEPTLEGICQYVQSIGCTNICYVVCNGLYAVQFDIGAERQIAFADEYENIVTLDVYCNDSNVRNAYAQDLFSSVQPL